MKLNANKTKSLIVSRSHTVDILHSLASLSCRLINISQQITILDVIFDSEFNFIDHNKNKSSIASRKVGIICKVTFIYQDEKVNLCFGSFVLPLFEYCSPIWMPATDNTLNLLSKIVWSAHFLFPSDHCRIYLLCVCSIKVSSMKTILYITLFRMLMFLHD